MKLYTVALHTPNWIATSGIVSNNGCTLGTCFLLDIDTTTFSSLTKLQYTWYVLHLESRQRPEHTLTYHPNTYHPIISHPIYFHPLPLPRSQRTPCPLSKPASANL